MKAGYLVAALALCSTSALAASYAYFDRPDNASDNSHAAVSSDVYVRGFGWAWGDLQFKQDPGAATPNERQARDGLDRRDAAPGRHNDGGGNAPPRPRGKISMNLAAAPVAGTEAAGPVRTPPVPVAVVR
ncbi:hypothetical protein [Cupriavidus necator]|uniref:Uncharacterized protein n=1 Tax=Cupriavidus pinatubonensis (strain JMP 134 / LMG 1197) TaxID=264198 RepID=Q46QA3_CUPPJ|nr:hypothetical protein [Cupriavidus necator]